jgi:hypothetical protein
VVSERFSSLRVADVPPLTLLTIPTHPMPKLDRSLSHSVEMQTKESLDSHGYATSGQSAY